MSASPATSHAAGLFERHRASVLAYCLSRLGRRDEAEDAVQTTFVRALQSLDAGIVPASEPAWLLGIARNVCLARHESAVRRGRLEEVRDPADLEGAAGREDHRHDELIGLAEALRRLPEPQRRAVLLRDWRGLSYDEIALELGVSHAAVETLIFRGRNALAALLDETPAATRRRLASLGDVGALFASVKHAFLGAAAVTKAAAALVAVTAVSGAGLAVGTVGTSDAKPAPQPPAPATTDAAAADRTGPADPQPVRREKASTVRADRTAEHVRPTAQPVAATPAPPASSPAAPAPPPVLAPVIAPGAAAAPEAESAPAPAAPDPPSPAEPVEKTLTPAAAAVDTAAADVAAAVEEVEETVAATAATAGEAVETVADMVESTLAPVSAAAPAVPPLPPLPPVPPVPPVPTLP